MTTNETLQALKAAGKTIGVTRLYFYFNKLGIKPTDTRQRPQQYPNDSAERILKHLGFSTLNGNQAARGVTAAMAMSKGRVTRTNNGHAAEIISTKSLAKISRQARKGKRK